MTYCFLSSKITSKLTIQQRPIDEQQYPMSNTGDNIRKSLLKRQEALDRFNVKKESFLQTREKTINDIEEARKILANTMEQLPKNHFN